jgi:hypothetical protein
MEKSRGLLDGASDQHHGPGTLSPEKEPRVSIGQERGWASQPICICGQMKNVCSFWELDPPILLRTEIKYGWNNNSTSPYVFMAYSIQFKLHVLIETLVADK